MKPWITLFPYVVKTSSTLLPFVYNVQRTAFAWSCEQNGTRTSLFTLRKSTFFMTAASGGAKACTCFHLLYLLLTTDSLNNLIFAGGDCTKYQQLNYSSNWNKTLGYTYSSRPYAAGRLYFFRKCKEYTQMGRIWVFLITVFLKGSKHYGRVGMTMIAMGCVFLKGKLSIFWKMHGPAYIDLCLLL